MNIYIDVLDSEYPISFTSKPHPSGGTVWLGSVTELTGISMSFIEKDGTLSNLKYDESKINTNKEVIYERLNIVFADYVQSRNDEFEKTEADTISERDVIIDPYNPDDIRVRKDLYSISDIFSKFNKEDIDLNPDFQRHFVWNKIQKSRLIESILLGIPLPVFYFAEEKDGIFSVVDGLQRLSTIRDFLMNKFELTNLQHLGSYCNKKCFGISEGINDRTAEKVRDGKEIDRKFQRRIENTQLNVNIIEASSPPKVKYDIFNRINEGGKPLNKQEIRNSLAKHTIRELLQELAKSQSFINATNDISDTRMGAQEMVLRFIGFYLSLKKKHKNLKYQGDMNDFLDKTNEALKQLQQGELQEIKIAFLKSMENAYHLFGRYCFRKYLPEQLDNPNGRQQLLNKALFVTWSIALCEYNIEQISQKFVFESFTYLLAAELQNNTEYFNGITNRSSDRLVIENSFTYAFVLAQKYL